MNRESIRGIVLSDIHLGHPRNKTDHILDSLYSFISNIENPWEVDLLIIAGDLFDSLLDFDSKDAIDIIVFMKDIMNFCKKRNIIIRVLEGTPSHDWKQAKWFETVKSLANIDINFKYVDVLSIEKIQELGITILYIPDEWNSSNDVTYKEVKALMKSESLSQIDIIVMHGQFDYQIPEHLNKIPRHNSSLYIPLAKYYIFIGHVHQHTTYENIIAQGSFDRLSHNDEIDKGAVEFTINQDGTKSYKFIKNNNARIFLTLDFNEITTIDKIYKKINKVLSTIPINSYVRLRLNKGHPLLTQFKEFTIKYPTIHWSTVLAKDNTPSQTLFLDNKFTKYESISITPGNILDLVSKELENNINKDRLLSLLQIKLKELG